MKKSNLQMVLAAGALVASISAASAADVNGFYVLGGIGRTFNNNDQSGLDNSLRAAGATGFSSSLGDPTIYKLQLGYQINPYFAVEGGYLGSSSETYTASGGNLAGPVSASVKIRGWNLNGVGVWPLGNGFSLLGKLGIADIRSSGNVSGPGGTFSASGSKTNATFGIGAKYDFSNNVFVRADVDSYDIGSSGSSSRSTIWLLDLGYKF